MYKYTYICIYIKIYGLLPKDLEHTLDEEACEASIAVWPIYIHIYIYIYTHVNIFIYIYMDYSPKTWCTV